MPVLPVHGGSDEADADAGEGEGLAGSSVGGSTVNMSRGWLRGPLGVQWGLDVVQQLVLGLGLGLVLGLGLGLVLGVGRGLGLGLEILPQPTSPRNIVQGAQRSNTFQSDRDVSGSPCKGGD